MCGINSRLERELCVPASSSGRPADNLSHLATLARPAPRNAPPHQRRNISTKIFGHCGKASSSKHSFQTNGKREIFCKEIFPPKYLVTVARPGSSKCFSHTNCKGEIFCQELIPPKYLATEGEIWKKYVPLI